MLFLALMTGSVSHKDIKLVRTCIACPEQYDAYVGEMYVGYLRLRHGAFRIDDAAGNVLKTYYPDGDGIFTSYEREKYLKKARKKIALSLNEKLINEEKL